MYALRRIALFVPVWLSVAVLTFVMMRVIGGDPAYALTGGAALSVAALQQLHQHLGLDRPLLVQLWSFLTGAARGDLGISWQSGTPVSEVLAQRFPYTIELALTGLGAGTVLGLVIGVVAAIRPGSALDRGLMIGSLVFLSVPGFWLGIMLIYLFSVHLGWLPVAGAVGWRSLVMPAGVLAVTAAPIVARVARTGMLEALTTEFVRTARAKGLDEPAVLVRHALRNALNPILTIVGLSFGYLLGGAIIVEQVFSRPGVGTLAVQAIFARDYPVIQGIVLYTSTAFLVLNLLVDLSYSVADPRIRFG